MPPMLTILLQVATEGALNPWPIVKVFLSSDREKGTANGTNPRVLLSALHLAITIALNAAIPAQASEWGVSLSRSMHQHLHLCLISLHRDNIFAPSTLPHPQPCTSWTLTQHLRHHAPENVSSRPFAEKRETSSPPRIPTIDSGVCGDDELSSSGTRTRHRPSCGVWGRHRPQGFEDWRALSEATSEAEYHDSNKRIIAAA